MGTSIEFDRLAVQFPAENEFGTEEQHYLLVNQVGSDNVFDNQGRLARHWNFCAIGTEAQVITEVARAAHDIERGMLRYQNGPTKTENYVQNWRKELKDSNVLSVDAFTDKFHLADLVVHRPDKITDLDDRHREVFESVQRDWRRTQPEDAENPIYQADVTEETLTVFETMDEATHTRIDFKR